MKTNFTFLSTACGTITAALLAFACSSDKSTSNTVTPTPEAGTDSGGGSGGSGSGGKGGTGGKGGGGGAGGASKDGGGGGAAPDGGDGGTSYSVAAWCATKMQGDSGVPLTQIQCGEYIVRHITACGDCHSPLGAQGPLTDPANFLTGNPRFADMNPQADGGSADFVGTPNLTVLKSEGWTAADIKDAFLNGKRSAARGGAILPIMPYFTFHNMAAEDADAIAAFILSLPPKGTQIPARLSVPPPFIGVPLPVPPVPVTGIPVPAAGPNHDKAMAGMYLAGQLAPCMECHTEHKPPSLDMTKAFAGGEVFHMPQPFNAVTSLNITPAANGIQGWAATDVQKLILQGVDKDGTPICPPMPAGPFGAFGGMDPEQALDIGFYLTTIPGVSNPEDGGRFMMCVPPGQPPMDSGTGPKDAGNKG